MVSASTRSRPHLLVADRIYRLHAALVWCTGKHTYPLPPYLPHTSPPNLPPLPPIPLPLPPPPTLQTYPHPPTRHHLTPKIRGGGRFRVKYAPPYPSKDTFDPPLTPKVRGGNFMQYMPPHTLLRIHLTHTLHANKQTSKYLLPECVRTHANPPPFNNCDKRGHAHFASLCASPKGGESVPRRDKCSMEMVLCRELAGFNFL